MGVVNIARKADLITQDIYRGHFNPGASNDHLLKAGRWIIVGLLCCSGAIATFERVAGSLSIKYIRIQIGAVWPFNRSQLRIHPHAAKLHWVLQWFEYAAE